MVYDQQASGQNIYAYVGGNPLNFVDPWGLAPGDRYPTRDDAGIAAVCDINDRSKAENREYAGSVYKNPDDESYSYTAPQPGGPDYSNPLDSLPPDNVPVTAWYHTHGAYDPSLGQGNSVFSPQDVKTSDATGKPNYMADPFDNAHRYDPDPRRRGRGKTKDFGKKCGCPQS